MLKPETVVWHVADEGGDGSFVSEITYHTGEPSFSIENDVFSTGQIEGMISVLNQILDYSKREQK